MGCLLCRHGRRRLRGQLLLRTVASDQHADADADTRRRLLRGSRRIGLQQHDLPGVRLWWRRGLLHRAVGRVLHVRCFRALRRKLRMCPNANGHTDVPAGRRLLHGSPRHRVRHCRLSVLRVCFRSQLLQRPVERVLFEHRW